MKIKSVIYKFFKVLQIRVDYTVDMLIMIR